MLVAGRGEESRRWLGPGDDDPKPTACIVVDGVIVGWVDYDTEHDWLGPGEANVGYGVFARHQGKGYATRALLLLLRHLATTADVRTATLSIDPANDRSLRVAERAGFVDQGMRGSSRYFTTVVASP